MTAPTSSQTAAHPLANLAGTILLVGAGKMGSAMLEGWLALGLDAKQVAVIEPQPAGEIAALASRGLRLNPSPGAAGEVAAVVVAVKPQVAPEVMPTLAPFVHHFLDAVASAIASASRSAGRARDGSTTVLSL